MTPAAARLQDEWLSQQGLCAWEVGIEALDLMRRYESEFWAAHVAAQTVTPPLLLGVVAAFFQLQELRGLELQWPGTPYESLELSLAATPEETLVRFDGVSAEYLADLGHFVLMPRPMLHGIGVQLYMDEGYDMSDPLTLALWWLATGTALDTGMDMGVVVDAARGLAPGVEQEIVSLRPLSGMGDEVCTLAATHIPEAAGLVVPADLIRYAFGQTSKPLANTSVDEEQEVWGGEGDDYAWADRDRLVRWSGEAAAIATAYEEWAARITRAGVAGIEEVSTTLHAAARTIKRRDAHMLEETAA